jgi:hypothetical protein
VELGLAGRNTILVPGNFRSDMILHYVGALDEENDRPNSHRIFIRA